MPTVIKKLSPTPLAARPAVVPLKKSDPTAGLVLPDKMKEADNDLSHYTLLLYGREKIGKTTILSSFPEAIFFSTEPGTKGLRIFEFNSESGGVKDWAIFRKGVDLLIANPGRFKTVVIDTVDRAYDMCLDWVCFNRNIEYPGRDDSGKEDFGKSWRAVKMEFLEQVHRLSQSGRGVCFTSHAKLENIKSKSTGEEYSIIRPSMSNQARAVVEAIVDLFFYAEYVRLPDGSTGRVLICQGDETIWAGARATVTKEFPQFVKMSRDNGYQEILDAFLGKSKGLHPSTFLPSKSTTPVGRTFISQAKVKAQAAK